MPKDIKLRAFKIENPNITEPDSGILGLLQQVLTTNSIAQNRRLRINEQDDDEDLISSFEWHTNHSYLFGMMLRIAPGNYTGQISNELLRQNMITINDIETGDAATTVSKGVYYFALNNSHVVTNLPGNNPISRLQTYLNWILESVRGDRLFNFTTVTRIPEGIRISDIKSVEFGHAYSIPTQQRTGEENFTTKMTDLTNEAINSLFGQVDGLDEVLRQQLISAKLVLRIKKKPQDMQKAEYQRFMGAITTPLANGQGITIHTKKGGSVDGSEVLWTKNVRVETTENNRISEQQLKQEMEAFLGELATA